ncbi:hypothetical protein [Methylomonas rosea]|uniref:Uncharacterized protein n=1 Tax=Methylomonas rosea TaxID=2952227 RepID=A0ABT1TUZ5_9GAMM|nr:hypothetical protein [Methylomonas sp. WSC-7]MCQ8118603.1 hypothetical protein [Methylomonas sp. WSC-7]
MDTIGGIITIMGMVTGHILERITLQEWAITLPHRRAISHGRR